MSEPRTDTATLKSFAKASSPDALKVTALFVMFVAILYFGKEVIVPITLALLLAFILAPLVDLLTRWNFGRVPSVLLGVLLALGVVGAIASVVGMQIADLTGDLPQYTATIEAKVATVKNNTVGRASRWADQLGSSGNKGASNSPKPAQPQSGQTQPSAAPQAQSTLSPSTLAERYLTTVLSPLATFGVVFVVAVFALLQREDLRNRLIRLVGSDDLHHTTLAIDDGGRRLSRYFITQLIINSVFGIVIGIGLLVIGVPNPILWGVLSALLRFVPYVGSIISAVLPIILAAAVAPGWTMVLWTGALYLIVELSTGQIIEPLVYGNSTGLSPFSVIVAAIFWSWVWGPVGLILSTPLTLCLVVIGRHVERLAFLDVLLGDRAPLTPTETFYQRILAGDPDEAQDHAELLLKEISLSTYYDEVALAGLRRAARDTRRGAIDHEQLSGINRAVGNLISGLESHIDKQPAIESDDTPPLLGDDDPNVRHNPDPQSISETTDRLTDSWRHRPAVLCIAGRGPLDEMAATLLVQLLGKHGMNARLVPYKDVSRENISSLDIASVAMACICYLDITEGSASLRYLMHRLRQHLPKGSPILVGLSSRDNPAQEDEKLKAGLGADYFAGSLEQAVSSCADAARKAGYEGR